MSALPAVRVLAGPPVLRIDRSEYRTDVQEIKIRERKGNAAFTTYAQGAIPIRYMEGQRLLTNAELWMAYRQCPDIRSCVDGITRKVSTWDWTVAVKLDASDPRHERAQEVAAEAMAFFAAPNTDGETWQTVLSKMVRDLMVFDALSAEHVMDARGNLVELVAIRGGDVTPQVDVHQRLVQYRQDSPAGAAWFEVDQLLYLNLFPNTTTPGGLPIIESLVNEIITLMRQSKHLMLAVDADEVAPGLLVLAGLAGKAADRAVEGLRNMKGRDDKLRVLTSANPGGLSAEWIEFRHTPKDLELKDIVKEVRRTVWRLFGVKPVSQGDTEATPRATAEVQADAEESDLILPILEALQGAINLRTIPLVVGDPDLATMVEFRFDMQTKRTPEAEKAEGERDAADFDRGVITVNERRAIRGQVPYGPEGDIPLVKGGGGYVRLIDLVSDPVAVAPVAATDAISDAGPKDGEDGGVVDPTATDAPAVEESRPRPWALSRPGFRRMPAKPLWSMRAVRHHDLEPCNCYQHRSGTLPSDWQPKGRFDGYRVLNLSRLGDHLMKYARDVSPLYRRARIDVVAAARSYLKDGKIDNQELIPLTGRIANILDALESQWSDVTESLYRGAAQVGRDAAVHWTGAQVVPDWRERGDRYHARAMSYLIADKGLISDLRADLVHLLVSVVRSRPAEHRGIEDDPTAVIDGIDAATLLGAMRKVFDSSEYRIQNWSGRLVELANDVFIAGMTEGTTAEPAPVDVTPTDLDPAAAPASVPVVNAAPEWYYEWVSVGDSERCDTCVYEGTRGFRPVSHMSVQPGGATQCRGRCRCVLVFWQKSEVDSGTAVSLSNGA